jgi:hypothetical protein
MGGTHSHWKETGEGVCAVLCVVLCHFLGDEHGGSERVGRFLCARRLAFDVAIDQFDGDGSARQRQIHQSIRHSAHTQHTQQWTGSALVDAVVQSAECECECACAYDPNDAADMRYVTRVSAAETGSK